MAFEITSDTIVKILIRRGEEYDRKLTLLTNGELGYSQDIKRLFIGDGVSLGGNPVSNLFLGVVADKDVLDDAAHTGDLVFQTTTNTLFVYDENYVDKWYNIHPYFNERVFSEAGGEWYLDSSLFAAPFSYNPTGPGNSVTGLANTIDFNKTYLSLSAAYGSFYFGDIDERPPGIYTLSATCNVEERLFIHSLDNPYNRIQIHAKEQDGASVIRAERGAMYLQGVTEASIFSNDTKVIEVDDGSYVKIHYAVVGDYNTPNFMVDGNSRFVGNVNYDSNVTITGNLSVYGDVSYFETFVTATSSLSVINWSQNNTPALDVKQNFNAADQPIALFYGNPVLGNNRWPVLTVKDGPFVGIGTGPSSTRGTTGVVFAVSGGALFQQVNSTDKFEVFAGSGGITFNAESGGTGDLRSYFGGVYNTQCLGAYGLSAANFILNSSHPSNAGIRIFTNTSSAGDNKIGLSIDSATQFGTGSTTGNGSLILPCAAAAGFNALTQARDTVIVARDIAGPDSSTVGLVLGVHSAGSKGIRITSDGNVGIGIANPGSNKLYVAGASRLAGNVLVNGVIQATNDIVAFFTSDSELKKDIKVISSPLNKIQQISGVEFNWNEEKQETHKGHDIGVIAQEVEKILPEAVTTRDNGYKAVKYEKLVPLLIEAIKELNAQVEILKNQK